jgi:hypothetical protein
MGVGAPHPGFDDENLVEKEFILDWMKRDRRRDAFDPL